jgi:hypothetical protein
MPNDRYTYVLVGDGVEEKPGTLRLTCSAPWVMRLAHGSLV